MFCGRIREHILWLILWYVYYEERHLGSPDGDSFPMVSEKRRYETPESEWTVAICFNAPERTAIDTSIYTPWLLDIDPDPALPHWMNSLMMYHMVPHQRTPHNQHNRYCSPRADVSRNIASHMSHTISQVSFHCITFTVSVCISMLNCITYLCSHR